jgi:metallo-beta-lactamase family protein
MKLMFVGSAHEVTGSCHYLNACGKHILVDYGMEQGQNLYENVGIPVEAPLIDYVFLTHFHGDHYFDIPFYFLQKKLVIFHITCYNKSSSEQGEGEL